MPTLLTFMSVCNIRSNKFSQSEIESGAQALYGATGSLCVVVVVVVLVVVAAAYGGWASEGL